MRYAETGFDLEIDLTRGNIERVQTDPELTRLYLGGQGAAAEILWERVPPEVEPFSPDNLLIFSAGLLAATPVPGANRTCVSSISPQSNLYVDSGFEGFFGPELKHAGYDKIVIRGKSSGLVYLWIHDDQVEIRDASHLRGKSPQETAALIQRELKDPKLQVAAIGIAGENKVCQASIEHANTSASRGVGVIMGDKGLKAIAVRGTKDLNIAQPAELFEICIRQYREIYDNPSCGDVFLSKDDDSWHVNNLAGSIAGAREKNYWIEEIEEEWKVRVESERITTQWENYSQEFEEIRETVIDQSELLRGTGCYNCPKECHRSFYLPGARKYFLKNYGKLVYAMAAYKDLKFNFDLLAAMQEYGLDEAAMPQVLAFVLELYQAGILTDQDLPEFPDDGVGRFLYLLGKVARREGIGDALANGLYLAARQIGKGAEAYDRTGKKVEQLPLKRETANYPFFLMHATGGKMDITQIEGSFPQVPIPGKNERAEFVKGWDAAPENFKQWFLEWEPGQPYGIEAAVNIADWNEAMHYADDALGVCPLLSSFRGQFGGRPPYHLHNLPKLISLATGMDLDSDGLLAIARRNRQLVRAINVRRGLRRIDENPSEDLWPDRDPEMEQKYLDAYYEFKGWTREGIPARETLDRLGLDYVSEDLRKEGDSHRQRRGQKMRYAETGLNLEIDLSQGTVERVKTDPRLTELHLGGQGTAAKILWDRVPPEVEPFSPDNLLIFSAGLFHGTPVPGANRTSVSTFSPLTNLYVNSLMGGWFGPELKYAGYDKIVIRGEAPGLVYLWIHNDKVEIRDASHLQGKGCQETASASATGIEGPQSPGGGYRVGR